VDVDLDVDGNGLDAGDGECPRSGQHDGDARCRRRARGAANVQTAAPISADSLTSARRSPIRHTAGTVRHIRRPTRHGHRGRIAAMDGGR
jgi:hypothetical protein